MKIEQNKVVKIHYTLKDKDGKVLDSSVERDPLQYVHGHGYLISGLEKELEGKEPGAKFSTQIAPKDGYGEYDEKLVIEVPRDQFDSSVEIEVGMQFQADSPMGPSIVTVKKVADDKITIDANHELAGKDLFFDVEVVEVRDLTEEEVKQMTAPRGGCSGSCGSCGGCGSSGGDCGSCGGGGCN